MRRNSALQGLGEVRVIPISNVEYAVRRCAILLDSFRREGWEEVYSEVSNIFRRMV